jgi:chromosomal replication initiation ATPase DnaA
MPEIVSRKEIERVYKSLRSRHKNISRNQVRFVLIEFKIGKSTNNELISLISATETVLNIDLSSRNRKKDYVWARWIYFYLAKKKGYYLSQITRAIGYNHATAVHGLKEIDNLRFNKKMEADFLERLNSVKNYISLKLR